MQYQGFSKSNKTSSYVWMLLFWHQFWWQLSDQQTGSKSNKTSSFYSMPCFRKQHEKTEMALLVIIIFLFLQPSNVSGKDWRGLVIGLWNIFGSFRCSDANQTPEKNLREKSRSIYKTRCFVAGILKSPDRLGSKTTATKFRGCAWANWVIVLTVNSVFPAEMTPAVT